MSQSLGSIYVSLEANTAKFVEGLSKAAYVAQQSARNISKEFSSLQRVASATFGAFGAMNPAVSQLSFALSSAARASADAMKSVGSLGGAVGAIASISAGATAAMASIGLGTIALAMHTAESTAKLYEQSQAAGVSVEALSGLGFAAKQAGIDQEVMTLGLERMARTADAAARAPETTSNAFKRLGVAVKDSAGEVRPSEAIFADLAARFAAMPDGVQKTALAIQIFGRGGAQLIPILNEGSAGIQELLEKAQQLGVVISGSAARSAHEFESTMREMTSAIGGASIQLTSELLPSLQTIANALLQTTEDGHTGLQNITHWTAEFVEGTLGVLNTFMHGFEQIGIVIETVGHTVVASLQTIATEAKIAMQLSRFDFSGAESSAEAGLNNVSSVFTDFWAETKQNWKENSDFINGVLGVPTPFSGNVAAKLGSWPGEALMKGPGRPLPEDDESAGKKLAEALKSITERLKEEAATAGETSGKIEQYRLKVLGATPAQLAFVASLQQTANAAEIAAGKLGNVKMQPSATSISALATLHDKYSGLSADGGKWVESLKEQGAAIDALVDAAAPFKGMSVDLSTIGAAIGAQGPKSYTDVALQAADAAGLRISRPDAKGSGFSENLPDLEDMRTALAGVGESTVLVDAAIQSGMDRMVSKIGEAAMHVGTLDQRFKGLLGTVAQQGEDLGGKFFETFSKGIDDISDQLAHFVITGQSSFKKMFEGLGENLLKSSFQSSFGMLASLALGEKPEDAAKGALSGKSGLAFTVAGAFGIKLPGAAGGKKDGSTEGSALYVFVTNAGKEGVGAGLGGGVDSLGSLPLLKSAGAIPSLQNFTSPLSSLAKAFSSTSTPSSATPFGDFGGSLQAGPTPPITNATNFPASPATGNGNGLATASSLVHSGISLGEDVYKLWPKIASIFGGFLAGGGDVTPGKTYIVGEKHPEFFTPKTAGTVSPSLTMGGGSHQTVVNMHIHGVQDADSFRKSQTQIYANLHAQLALANSRG